MTSLIYIIGVVIVLSLMATWNYRHRHAVMDQFDEVEIMLFSILWPLALAAFLYVAGRLWFFGSEEDGQ